jgi:hypothetical protein
MLTELADHDSRKDGFLDRILLVMPATSVGSDWTDETVADASKAAWAGTLAGLRTFPLEVMEDGMPGYRAVPFSAAAKEAWVAWWNAHAAETRSPDLPATLIGPWGKLRNYAARLALVFHYLWLVQTHAEEGDVGAPSVERAARVVEYLKGHLRVVYGRLRQTPEDDLVFEVLDWVRQRGGEVTARDLVHARKVTPTARAKKVLAELEERGYGRTELRAAANGKRVRWFVFEPGAGH